MLLVQKIRNWLLQPILPIIIIILFALDPLRSRGGMWQFFWLIFWPLFLIGSGIIIVAQLIISGVWFCRLIKKITRRRTTTWWGKGI